VSFIEHVDGFKVKIKTQVILTKTGNTGVHPRGISTIRPKMKTAKHGNNLGGD
jgi:hypothetical protein